MTISKKALSLGAALALSAAGMTALSTTASAEGAQKIVHCYDVNKCKGHNDCKSAENACKGHSKCKGHGFVSMPASSCDHIGGTTKKGG